MNVKDVSVLIRRSCAHTRTAASFRVCIPDSLIESGSAQATLRNAVYGVITRAQKNKIASIDVTLQGLGTRDSVLLVARLVAQEIFRYVQNFQITKVKKILIVAPDAAALRIVGPTIEGYLAHMLNKICQGPFLTVDALVEHGGGLVMVERKNPPLGWAMPGGFVDRGETVEHAVAREIKEETNLTLVGTKYFKTCSDPLRDPRFHTVTIVFSGIGRGKLYASSDAKSARVYRFSALPKNIAFDHREVIQEYIRSKHKIWKTTKTLNSKQTQNPNV